MTYDQMYETVRTLVFVCAIATTTFVLAYGIFAPWYQSWTGRSILMSSAASALLIDLTLSQTWRPVTDIDTAFWMQVAAFGYAAVAYTILLVVLIVTLVRNHRR